MIIVDIIDSYVVPTCRYSRYTEELPIIHSRIVSSPSLEYHELLCSKYILVHSLADIDLILKFGGRWTLKLMARRHLLISKLDCVRPWDLKSKASLDSEMWSSKLIN